MKRSFLILISMAVLITLTGLGQMREPLRDFLFPPQLVMRHQQELNLSDTQREQILSDIERSQSEFTRLRWNLEAEMDQLRVMLEDPKPNESAVLAQLDAVLDLEREIKKTQLTLAVRIKSVLNREQLQKLEELRRPQRPRFRQGGPGGSPPGGAMPPPPGPGRMP